MKRVSETEAITGNLPVSAPKGWESVFFALRARVAAAFTKLGVNRHRTLRLCESLSLGEKRIIAVVECDDQRFLLAATPQNISLLQSLGPAHSEERQQG